MSAVHRIRPVRTILIGAIVAAMPYQAAAQVSISGRVVGSSVEHRVNAGTGVEQSSGTVFGADVLITLGRWIELSGHGLNGKLKADSAFADDRDLTELEAVATVKAMPWLAFQVGTNLRSYTTLLARQRWTTVRLGAETRLRLAGPLVGIIRAGLMPVVSISGLDDPDIAYHTGAGIEWRGRRVAASIIYSLERYDFPTGANVFQRLEQVSSLTAAFGLRFGR